MTEETGTPVYTWNGVLRWLLVQLQQPTLTELEKLMAKQDEVLSDLGAIKANQAETKDDLLEVKTIVTSQTSKITTLEARIVALQGQIDNPAILDEISKQVAQIKADSRAIADIVDEPAPAPAP